MSVPDGVNDWNRQVIEEFRAWRTITAAAPGFAEYQQKTSRVIPVLALRRRSS